MDYLCAPWRSEYFTEKRSGCPFCDAAADAAFDDRNGVLFRARHCFGVMNLYPYSPGAFMVIPYEHVDNIECLSDDTWAEMSRYVRAGVGFL